MIFIASYVSQITAKELKNLHIHQKYLSFPKHNHLRIETNEVMLDEAPQRHELNHLLMSLYL